MYDLSTGDSSQFANISTRGFVETGDGVIIGGFILAHSGGEGQLVLRGLGPSLAAFGVANVLANPALDVRDQNGVSVASNDDWQSDATQASFLRSQGLAPTNALEAALPLQLPEGSYTVILSGVGGTSGNGLIEIYRLP